jgi:glycosyltransferase involved in cell wall biosynthesis
MHVALPGSFPYPSAVDLDRTRQSLFDTPRNAVLLIDGLAYGAMPADWAAALGRPIVALVHHPLGFESGLSPDQRSILHASEAAALAVASRVIVTSTPTARLLASAFTVPPERIRVAEPGVESAARAQGTGSPVQLLAVGAVSPRKGHDILVEALSGLKGLDWRLRIAGSLDRDPGAVHRLRRGVAAAGLVTGSRSLEPFRPAPSIGCIIPADVFVSASLFEGYGMALAEAMAHGLPLVASTGGAAAETAADGAGLKVPPNDVDALRDALRRLITQPQLRRDLSKGSWAAGRRLPCWGKTAATVARVLREVGS